LKKLGKDVDRLLKDSSGMSTANTEDAKIINIPENDKADNKKLQNTE